MTTRLPTGDTRPLPRNGRPTAPSSGWRWLLLFVATWLSAAGGAQAQARADAYGFTQTNGTYTAITATDGTGNAVAHTGTTDDANTAATIPFSFLFAGTVRTAVTINSNGHLTFPGAGTSSTSNYTPISATTTYNGAISPLGSDLQGNTAGEVRYTTLGSSPNRVFVVQWQNYRAFAASGENYNFQVRLTETTNVVDLVYGPFTVTTGRNPQVGLRGTVNTDFNNRQLANSWLRTNSGAALANTTALPLSATVFPPSGLTFTYTPSATANLPAIRPTASTIAAATASVSFVAPTIAPAPTGYVATVVVTSTGTPVTGSPFTVTASPFSITGLAPSTNYTVSIVTTYAAGNSLPTETRFQSAANCLAPSALAITNNTTGNSASLSFTNAASGVNDYTVTTTPATSSYTVASAPSATPLSLTGLSAATTYVVTVRSNCTAGGQSDPITTTFTTPSQAANFTTARNTGIAFTSIQGTGTSFTWQGTSTDDNVTTTVPLTAGSAAAGTTAFAFNYLGLNVQGFQVSTNGWLTFNTANTSTSFTNNLSATSPNLVLAPFWEDLVIQGNPGTPAALAAAKIKYRVSGAVGSRKLTVEWGEMETFNNAGPNLNFQAVLTEGANTIEYRYGNMSGFDGSLNYNYTYSLGMSGVTATTPNTYLALDVPNSNYFLQNNASSTSPLQASITAATVLTAAQRGNSLSIAPACNTALVFTPAASFVANAAPTAVVPANNEPAGAITLALGSGNPTDFCAVYSSANATATSGVLACSAATPGNADDDVWFKFVVPVFSDVTVTLRSSGAYDGVLQLFYADGAGNIATGAGSALDCKNATAAGLSENVIVTALDPGTYYVRVYEAGTGSGYNGAFVVAAFATPAPPPNDNCAGALNLNASGATCVTTAGSTSTATATTGAPVCSATTPGNADDDVWYKFTTGAGATNDNVITLQSGAGFDGVLQVFSGTCTALTAISCTNGTSTGGTETTTASGLAASTTYLIRVYHAGSGAGSGNFTLCVTRPCSAPTAVNSNTVTDVSANITFTPGTNSSSYTVTATPASGPAVTNTGAASPIALTGLVANTTYTVVVQGNCNAASTSAPYNFTTSPPCAASTYAALPYTQGFEGAWINNCGASAVPSLNFRNTPATGNTSWRRDDDATTAGWSSNAGAFAPAGSNAGGASSLHAARFHSYDSFASSGPGNFDLFVNGGGSGTPLLTFDYINTSGTDVMTVLASTDGGLTFAATPLLSLGVSAAWSTQSVAVPNNATTVLRFSATGDFGITDIGLDNIGVSVVTCSPPSGITFSGTTPTSTNVNFSSTGIGNTSFTVTATPTSGPAVSNTGTASPIALTGLAPTTTYSVVVAGNCGPAGVGAPVSFTTPPANDLCGGAIAVACGSVTNGTNANATLTGEPTAFCVGTTPSTTSPGVFYSFAGNNRMVTLSTDNPGTNFDTKLFVYSGSCGALVCVTGDDDGGDDIFAPFGSSRVRFPALAGTTYYIVVAGFSGTGNFGLSVDCNDPVNNLTVSTAAATPAGSFNDVTITGTGTSTLGGTLTVFGDLNVLPGGTLNTNCQIVGGSGTFTLADGSTLGICSPAGITASGATGAVQVAGARNFGTDANFVYSGTGAQAAGNGLPARVRNLTVNNANGGVTLNAPTSVRQLLRLQNGGLATGGNALTLLSQDGYGTAVVDNTGGVVTGTATVQRAVDQTPVGTSGNIGYHHYSSPVTATTLADIDAPAYANTYNPAYNAAADPGTVRPFPTVFGYDETRLATSPATTLDAFSKGWFSPAGTGDAMTVGKGYSANIPNAVVIDFVGTLNTGNQNITGLTRGTDGQAGWHLVGNPYPSPLNWDNVAPARRTGLDGAMYVANSTGPYSGTYRTRAGGIGGSPLIVAGSGFFVRTAVGQTGSLSLTNADRETTFGAQPAFGRDARPQLTLTLADAAGTRADDAYVYLQAGATAAFDPQFDAAKLPNSTGLNLTVMAGAERLAISGLPLLTGPALVPLTVGVPAVGRYALSLGQLANFGGVNLVLRDNLTGARTPLVAGTSYPFAVSAYSTAGRFVLELNPAAGPLASASQVLAAQVQVYPNPSHGRFTLTLPAMAGAGTAQATLLNALGQVVATRTIALGTANTTAEFVTTALPTGVYALTLKLGNETVTRRVVVE